MGRIWVVSQFDFHSLSGMSRTCDAEQARTCRFCAGRGGEPESGSSRPFAAKGFISGFSRLPLLCYRPFHSLDDFFDVPWLFTFEHPEFSATGRACGHKVEFLVRRKHQVVALAAPGHMIAKSPPVGGLALFPLDGYIFVKSGHSPNPRNAFYSTVRRSPREPVIFIMYNLVSPRIRDAGPYKTVQVSGLRAVQ